MMKCGSGLLLFLLSVSQSFAQVGGSSIYQFVNLPSSSRMTALGGSLVPVKDDDPNLGMHNPSALSPGMNNSLAFNFMTYFPGNKSGNVSLIKDFGKLGTYSGAIQFINYGNMRETDEAGNVTGTFQATEFNLNLGWGKQIDSAFSIGVSSKVIASYLQTYSSYGLLFDAVATYYYPMYEFAFIAAARNIGFQLKPYTEGEREPLPFDLQAGISKKLANAPIRFILVAHDLQKFDLSYPKPVDPSGNTNVFGSDGTETSSPSGFVKFMDLAMRHVIVGSEVLIGKSFIIHLAYNYQRRKELVLLIPLTTLLAEPIIFPL
jgi:hypothetical protein